MGTHGPRRLDRAGLRIPAAADPVRRGVVVAPDRPCTDLDTLPLPHTVVTVSSADQGVSDLVQDGQAEIVADARGGLQQVEIAAGRLFGKLEQILFQDRQLRIIMADEREIIPQGKLADGIGFRSQQLFGPGFPVIDVLAVGRPVVRQLIQGPEGWL